jgi:peptide/histidine transporter 3/4
VVGFTTNMMSYLTSELHMPLTKAANTITNLGGTASVTPLIGAFIADSYAGRFWTITVASIIYQIVEHLSLSLFLVCTYYLHVIGGFNYFIIYKYIYIYQGMISLTLSAVLPQLRPPSCKGDEVCKEADAGQVAILYVSLLLGALGSGGIRPCVVAFGADQFDETDPKQNTKTWTYFNWYYFVMGASMLVAVTVLVYIQENIGWGWGLGIPTILMFMSIITFILGYPLYRNLNPAGSPFTRLVQVLVAACKKRNLPMVSDPKLLYQNDELDASISVDGKLLHTKQMK